MDIRKSAIAVAALGLLGLASTHQASAQVVTIEEAERFFPANFNCAIEGWMTRMPHPQAAIVNRSMFYRVVGATNWRFGGPVLTGDTGHPTLLYYSFGGPPYSPPPIPADQDVEVAIVLEWFVNGQWFNWFNTVILPGQP